MFNPKKPYSDPRQQPFPDILLISLCESRRHQLAHGNLKTMVVNHTPLDPMLDEELPRVSRAEEISRDEVLKLNQMQIIIIIPAYSIKKNNPYQM
jgi:hypothetical protein